MEIRSNSLATSVSRTLTGLNMQVARSIQRLSNGTRINSFADDIGGAAIADSMRAQIRGIHQSIRNSQDATAMVSTAEGGLHEIHQLITRIRDLVVDAANDTHTLETRQMFQLEINQLMDEINNISARTQYNSMDLLSGSLGLPHHPTLTLPITNRLPSYYSAASLHVHQMWQTDPPANAQLINFTGAPNASSFG
ncbi:MAG: flagellin, partial [Defluviitaleaceae bacterium]|nr:flagellin [Defluviitaleaceae bacterium]